MLGSIRKFSTSIYAKILLGIVIIPFVFWGMGSAFTSGSKNIVVITIFRLDFIMSKIFFFSVDCSSIV